MDDISAINILRAEVWTFYFPFIEGKGVIYNTVDCSIRDTDKSGKWQNLRPGNEDFQG